MRNIDKVNNYHIFSQGRSENLEGIGLGQEEKDLKVIRVALFSHKRCCIDGEQNC